MLGKFEWEILEFMSIQEFRHWIGYIKMVNDRRRREEAKQRVKAMARTHR